MEPIAERDIQIRIERDNPWWADPNWIIPEAAYPRRVYYAPFRALALNFEVRRATILLGPRRVGKTVIIKQIINDAMILGLDPKSIMYASIDAPIYAGIPLEKFVTFLPTHANRDRVVIIFDEIQYLPDWETHLKDLVDHYPRIKFIASGSAAAVLRLKSRESGAGRFSDFMLPPLTFYEFLDFTGRNNDLVENIAPNRYRAIDILALNDSFIDYLNFGGYPEAVLNEEIRRNAEQFIRSDIIDKVLLKDLPSLYGIHDIQGLNRLFGFLAYNAGNEASLENISQESGITKPTIKKYIEYLESAFLIMKLSTIDDNCKTMKRERNFKIYLNNPSMRAALFSPVRADDASLIGHLTESAIFSQWQHSPFFHQLKYARWRNEGEVDIVFLHGPLNQPLWIGEIKWSDRVNEWQYSESRAIANLLRKHDSIKTAFFTTKTGGGPFDLEGRPITVYPSALYCYTVGRNITARLESLAEIRPPQEEDEPSERENV